ncbi:response regulator [Parasedimentitalea denitrificans]|uniref:response regulator n=1 Tax=Parasedimentitalea denitrificans TaxID=2211118 RepID=UPI001430F1F5|nr:response regulator [Sedimentitalea sp. CY04]
MALSPQYSDIALSSGDGSLLCNSRPLKSARYISDPGFLQRALDENAFSVGGMVLDEAADGNGIGFAFPVKPYPDSAKPTAAVVAVVSWDWWHKALSDGGLPENAVAVIIDQAGQIAASFPRSSELPGPWISEIGPSGDVSNTSVGEVVALPDGQTRFFVHQALINRPDQEHVWMSLGVPVDAGLLAATKQTALHLAIFGGVLVVCWIAAMRLLERGVLGPIRLLRQDVQPRDLRTEEGGALGPDDVDQDSSSVSAKNGSHPVWEGATEHQRNHLEALLDATSDNYFHFDKDGRILDYRLQLERSWFKNQVNQYGNLFADVLPPAMGKKFKKEFSRFQKEKGPVTWTNQLDLDGVRHFREYRLCPIFGCDESVLMVRDASKLHLAEEQRDQSEARFQRIISNLPGMVISRRVADFKNVEITYVSPQCKDIWGFTEEEIYADAKVLESTIAPEDVRELAELAARAADEHKPYTHRFKIVARSGEIKWLETNTRAYHQEDGSLLTDGILMDVTSEVEVQQQLEKERSIALHAQKLESVGKMTGGVAHDFNNILAAIMGSLELLRDDLSEEEHLDLVDVGIGAARRGAELTGAMLAYARRARLEPQVVDLNKMVLETRKWAGRALPLGIEVETSLLTGLWLTKADISSTETALLNLILNARDAMPDGGVLTIETENAEVAKSCIDAREDEIEPGRYVVISVTDTGTGMSEKTLSQIFEPFITTKPVDTGSGLGLPMTMGFMRQSGGTVRVTSELGAGTTVKLFFKAEDEEEDGTVVTQPEVELPSSNEQSILVAEDEVNLRSVLVVTLKKAGYSVTDASSGDEALELFKANPTFDLLLTDIKMPGNLQGRELSKAVRDIAPDTPVIFMSGNIEGTTDEGNKLQKKDSQLMKPVLRADLLEAISQSLKN